MIEDRSKPDSDVPKIESQLYELREWLEAVTRRLEQLEATAFQLNDEEEVLLIAVPRRK